ncbi:MAG: diversity-generating retroelement protein Avd [Fusobacteriaceae bacterium]|jgi:four helix bundle protein|nr:diversity-generating retroelement protein Avd [Fusobacteriaceae bacterium]
MEENLKVIQKLDDFELRIYDDLRKFPKSEKFTMTAEIKNTIFEIRKKLVKAAKSEKKKGALNEADIELQHLKHLIQLSFELKYISPRVYEIISKQRVEIGAMLGAWLRNENAKQ